MESKLQLAVPAYWHRSSNFGDQLTPYLIEKISGRPAVYLEQAKSFEEITIPTLMVTGSILSSFVHNSIIWGNGYAWHNEDVHKPLEIAAVRGPLTRDKLLKKGVGCPEVYGDPALLLPMFYDPYIIPEYDLGIIPHMVDYKQVTEQYAEQLEKSNTVIIDLTLPIEEVINTILKCKRTISSSLHGIIVSHAYRIPSLWVKFSDGVIGDGFKFEDYFLSVGIKPYPALDLLDTCDIGCLMDIIPNDFGMIDTDKLYQSCPIKI
jgi:pyruvyltransferase